MEVENLKKANEINEQLEKLQEWKSGKIKIYSEVWNGGEGTMNLELPDEVKSRALEAVRKIVNAEIYKLSVEFGKL